MYIKINEIFSDYELIDCGNHKKLERFGNYRLIRPEASANGKPNFDYNYWCALANAEYIEQTKDKGYWKYYNNMPLTWNINYSNVSMFFQINLAFTNSKHIGVFPEQVLNWLYFNDVLRMKSDLKSLNLFGYTGLTSLALSHFSNSVTHVDSVKKVVEWTKHNAELSNITNIRFIVDDAISFVQREIKRKNKYNCIVLDPPAIGSGVNKRWILEKDFEKLLSLIIHLTEPFSIIIMNLYSYYLTFDYLIITIKKFFPEYQIDFSEKVYGLSPQEKFIDHGFFVRLRRI